MGVPPLRGRGWRGLTGERAREKQGDPGGQERGDGRVERAYPGLPVARRVPPNSLQVSLPQDSGADGVAARAGDALQRGEWGGRGAPRGAAVPAPPRRAPRARSRSRPRGASWHRAPSSPRRLHRDGQLSSARGPPTQDRLLFHPQSPRGHFASLESPLPSLGGPGGLPDRGAGSGRRRSDGKTRTY